MSIEQPDNTNREGCCPITFPPDEGDSSTKSLEGKGSGGLWAKLGRELVAKS